MNEPYNWEADSELFVNDSNSTQMETSNASEVKHRLGAACIIIGGGSALVELVTGAGHNLSHEVFINIGERAFFALPGLMTTYGGQNWLRGRPYFKGLLE